ncbi:MAG: efflux RND transporter periplasmic adaptor subunit [Desulfovibrio sp.]|uniref:efflux RND transporter periplasmic adaptor subunit n=1 Tax=Desulfovibrio sp. 7SRBS1 TaxID=3378064 RepID=UPI003B3EEF8C
MSHSKLAAILLVLVVFFSAAPCPAAQNATAVARPALIEQTLTGYTRARHVMEVAGEEAGRCLRVLADVGDTIPASGIFAVLDTTFIDLSIRKNQADQKRIQSDVDYNVKETDRYSTLVQKELEDQSTLDELISHRDTALQQMEALKIEEANLRERRTRFVIKARPGWRVTERLVEPGEWVSAGKVVGKAADFSTLLVPFAFTPEEFGFLRRQADEAKLFFPDEGTNGKIISAKVELVSPAFDAVTRKIKVDLAVSEGLKEKRGGLRAVLSVNLPDPSGAVFLPASCVKERYEEYWVTPEKGEPVRVVFLGHGPDGQVRVRSPQVHPGQHFLLQPE